MPTPKLARNMLARGSPLHLQYSYIDEDRPARRNRMGMQKKLDMMLLDAAWNGRRSAVKRLLRSGAYLLAADKDGMTSLHRAALAGSAGTVKLLIGHAKKQKNGIARSLLLAGTREVRCTALQYAAWKQHPQICDIILGAAQEIGQLDSLLAAKDAYGNDALMSVIQSNCSETRRVLFMYEDRASVSIGS
jgi:ankyrin repeat protein